jgi:hypothetical protein
LVKGNAIDAGIGNNFRNGPAYWSIVNDGLAASLARPQFTSSSIDKKTVPCAGLFFPRLEMSGAGEGLLDPDIPKRPDVDFD